MSVIDMAAYRKKLRPEPIVREVVEIDPRILAAKKREELMHYLFKLAEAKGVPLTYDGVEADIHMLRASLDAIVHRSMGIELPVKARGVDYD